MTQQEIKDLADWIAEEFDLDKNRVEETIGDWYNEVQTEKAFAKANKFEQDEIDNEQVLSIMNEPITDRTNSFDHYRRKAELCGYISRVDQGVFKIEKHIEDSTNWRILRGKAYLIQHPELKEHETIS